MITSVNADLLEIPDETNVPSAENIPPMVSICTAAYNHEQYVGKAIESVLAQEVNFRITSYNVCYTKLLRNGPSYIDISARYYRNKSAPQDLANKVISGGTGNWGNGVMIAHPQLSTSRITSYNVCYTKLLR